MSSPAMLSTAAINSQIHISSSTTLSSGEIAGIVIGSTLVFAILVCLAILLVKRRRQRRAGFERVENPRQLHGLRKYSEGLGHPSFHGAVADAERSGRRAAHGQQASVSLEPLLSRGTGQRHQPYPSPRSQSFNFSPPFRPVGEHLEPAHTFASDRGHQDVYDPYAEIDGPALGVGTAGRGDIPIPSTPPTVHWEPFLRGYTSHPRGTSSDQTDRGMQIPDRTATDSTCHKPLFINRTLRTHSDVSLPPLRASGMYVDVEVIVSFHSTRFQTTQSI
ncbi:hypothetical protein EDD17DRAFT_632733 [Pisolithus thermaeus]|nr:hypothetical protein EDD17DRAFT_632733 [Pisolithus thermaeus]